MADPLALDHLGHAGQGGQQLARLDATGVEAGQLAIVEKADELHVEIAVGPDAITQGHARLVGTDDGHLALGHPLASPHQQLHQTVGRQQGGGRQQGPGQQIGGIEVEMPGGQIADERQGRHHEAPAEHEAQQPPPHQPLAAHQQHRAIHHQHGEQEGQCREHQFGAAKRHVEQAVQQIEGRHHLHRIDHRLEQGHQG